LHVLAKLAKTSCKILLLSLVGCFGAPYFIHPETGIAARQCDLPQFAGVSPSIPIRLHASVRGAFEYWNEAIGKQIFLYVGEQPWEYDSEEYGGITIVSGEENYPRKSLAYASMEWMPDGCIKIANIVVNPKAFDRDMASFNTLMRHEIGHLLGLRHRDLFTEIMNPKASITPREPQSASQEEIRLLKELYGVKDGKRKEE